jgi:hypothetical protein
MYWLRKAADQSDFGAVISFGYLFVNTDTESLYKVTRSVGIPGLASLGSSHSHRDRPSGRRGGGVRVEGGCVGFPLWPGWASLSQPIGLESLRRGITKHRW